MKMQISHATKAQAKVRNNAGLLARSARKSTEIFGSARQQSAVFIM